jgi:hypothetical protein
MDSHHRQTIIFIGFMTMLMIVVVFLAAQGALSSDNGEGEGKWINGPILPGPANDIVNQSINGLEAAFGDAKDAREGIQGSPNSSESRG